MDSDTFRALARSSPWLWTSVRLTRVMTDQDEEGPVRAWIRRPGLMRVEPEDGRAYVVDDRDDIGGGRSLVTAVLDDADDDVDDATPGLQPPQPARFVPLDTLAPDEALPSQRAQTIFPEFVSPQDPRAPEPERRPDGLVTCRPDNAFVVYDDPMHQNYQWVAMLDPVELADGVLPDEELSEALADEDLAAEAMATLGATDPLTGLPPLGTEVLKLAEVDWLGRPSLAALLRPTSSYNPRCACCPLLYSEVSLAIDIAEGAPEPQPRPKLAEMFQVVLDRQTGICVAMRNVGGDFDGSGFDVEIEEVDADYPDSMFRQERRRRPPH